MKINTGSKFSNNNYKPFTGAIKFRRNIELHLAKEICMKASPGHIQISKVIYFCGKQTSPET
jgi:hypothetical protein